MTSGRGFVFVHGINQSPDDYHSMQQVADTLASRASIPFAHVWVGMWKSLGGFMADLAGLSTNLKMRTDAVSDVKTVIQHAWNTLQGTDDPHLLVCGHSMGQVVALMALDDLGCGRAFPVKTSLLTLGGPVGNANPVVRAYFVRDVMWRPWGLVPSKPAGVSRWVDMYNPLDPVCHDPVCGSTKPGGSDHVVFRVPGQHPLPIPNPFKLIEEFHGKYLEAPEVQEKVAEMFGSNQKT